MVYFIISQDSMTGLEYVYFAAFAFEVYAASPQEEVLATGLISTLPVPR